MNKFEELGLGKGLLETLKKMQFEEPTPIQEKAIPLVLKGKDVIGKAATGSGKTLAFGSGIITKLQPGKGVQALVLAPTRELAEQVSQALKKFSRGYELDIIEVYGGVSITPQINKLKRADVVVGTPGRIIDHLTRRTLDLRNVKVLVLDEADRMVDMGFLPDVEKIISLCPKRRQTLLFSATISPDIDYVSKEYMQHPHAVSVESYIDSSKLKQIFYDSPTNEKFSLLLHLIQRDTSHVSMVFCNTRGNVESVIKNLEKFGVNAVGIHGGMNQAKRNKVMEKFYKKHAHVLVCTDVAARGLDIKGVTHIYNYDVPKDSTDYIHRIGRTARAGKEGDAITLVSSKDYMNFRKVLDDESLKIEQEKAPEFKKVAIRFSSSRDDRGFQGRGRGGSRYGAYSTGGPRRDSGRGGSRAGSYGSRDSGRGGYGKRQEGSGGRSFGGRGERRGGSNYGKKPERGGERGGYGNRGRDSGRGGGGGNYGRRDSRGGGGYGGQGRGGRRDSRGGRSNYGNKPERGGGSYGSRGRDSGRRDSGSGGRRDSGGRDHKRDSHKKKRRY